MEYGKVRWPRTGGLRVGLVLRRCCWGVDWIEKRDLEQVTQDFIHHVERLAAKNNIPVLKARPGESHVDQAAEYLDTLADCDGGSTALSRFRRKRPALSLTSPRRARTRRGKSPGAVVASITTTFSRVKLLES